MISFLSGVVLQKGRDFVILKAGPVGYRVAVAAPLHERLRKGEEAPLYVHEQVREDGREMFGFSSFGELEFFWRLIDVQGVGARMALHILGLGSVAEVKRAIERGDIATISSAKGVGKKTAQRVILELQGKLVGEDGLPGGAEEVVSALENLGYARSKALQAAASVPGEGSTEERIKMALRLLAK